METAMIQTTEFETTQTTDPREVKLRDIIEKGKVSLHKTLEEIQYEFSIREDMAVRPTSIDFLVQGHLLQGRHHFLRGQVFCPGLVSPRPTQGSKETR